MNKILELKFGSHLYGTNTPESDLDFKGLYLPSAKEIILHSYKEVLNYQKTKKEGERNTKDDIDSEIFSLDRFLEDVMSGQTWALDMLFAPKEFYTMYTDEGIKIIDTIYKNRDKIINKNINAFVSYARKQAAKYGIKGSRMDALRRVVELLDTFPTRDKLADHLSELENLIIECKELVSMEKTPLIEIVQLLAANKVDFVPHLHVCGRKMPLTAGVKLAKDCYSAILNEYGERSKKAHLAGGVDFKALSHAVRVNNEALELLETGTITFPRPDKDLLINIKTGKMDPKEIYGMIEEGMVHLIEASKKSSLREFPDREWAKDFIYSIYSDIVKKG
jgi:hypothetical protein